MKKKHQSVIILGIALFTMLFGAGNLLLPGSLGWSSGIDVWNTFSGFATSGIIAPALAIFAVMISGNYFIDLGKRADHKLAYILATLNILCVGPVIALPRLGAAVYEVSVLPIFPEVEPVWACFLFFSTVMFLSFSYKKIVLILGKYLGPIMITLLILFIIIGLYTTNNETQFHNSISEPFRTGFLEGYQTMDVLGGVIFAVVLISGAKSKGYISDSERNNIVIKATLFAVLLMLLIYGSLFYIGSISPIAQNSESKSGILTQISTNIFGKFGMYYIAILMILVCLTTAIALTSAVANFFERITKNRLGYTEGVIMTSLISMIMAIAGVDTIMKYAVTILNIIYPIVLILILTVILFGKKVASKKPYLVAVIATTAIASLRSLQSYFPEDFTPIIERLPFHTYQIEWLVPGFLSFFITWLLTKKSRF